MVEERLRLMTSSSKFVPHLFWFLCIVGFFAILSTTMSKNPVLNPFARLLETPDSLLGFVVAASTIPGIIVSLPAGSLSDVFGRRKILLVSGVVFASAPFLYLFITSWWQLALVRFYHGFATAMFVPVANAFVADLYPTKRGERISLFSSATAVGRTIAPFLGGYVLFITNYGFHQLYLAVGIAGVIAFITALLLLKEGTQTSKKNQGNPSKTGLGVFQGWTIVASNPNILTVSLVEAAQYYAFGAVEFFFVGYLNEVARLSPFFLGIISGALLAMIPVTKPFMGRLSDKIGRRIPIVVGSLISVLALEAISFTTLFPLLLLISIAYGVGFSMVTSSTPALVSELAQGKLVGTSIGFLSTIMDVGQTLGPIITGLILATGLGYLGSFSILAVILLAACAIFVAARVAKN
jgi:MFS family permease